MLKMNACSDPNQKENKTTFANSTLFNETMCFIYKYIITNLNIEI